MKKLEHILEAIILIIIIIIATIWFIHFDDMKQNQVNPLNKYDSITAKLPVEEKIINFNDVPLRKYFDKDGILTIKYQ